MHSYTMKHTKTLVDAGTRKSQRIEANLAEWILTTLARAQQKFKMQICKSFISPQRLSDFFKLTTDSYYQKNYEFAPLNLGVYKKPLWNFCTWLLFLNLAWELKNLLASFDKQ